MKNIRKITLKSCLVCVAVFCFLAFTSAAQAEYEIDTSPSNLDTNGLPVDGTIVQWTDDVTIQWAKPTILGDDFLNGFVYKWNNSDETLDGDALSISNADGTVATEPYSVVKAAGDFAEDDESNIRYLHIRTYFNDASNNGNPDYSTDVVIGPINIDNVAPNGSIRVTDADGNDITNTQSTTLNLRLQATPNPETITMYISEDEGSLGTGTPYSAEETYDLVDTETTDEHNPKTIYVVFEDSAGNRSAFSDSVELLDPAASISPYDPTLDLSLGTQEFIVDGNSDPYNWAIIEETPDDVAQISGGDGTNSVTVTLLNAGTFKLQAVPDGGGDTLTSGVISVEQTYTLGDVNDDDVINSGDAILVLRYAVKLIDLTSIQQSAADVNNDGSINSGDAILILRYAVKLIDQF